MEDVGCEDLQGASESEEELASYDEALEEDSEPEGASSERGEQVLAGRQAGNEGEEGAMQQNGGPDPAEDEGVTAVGRGSTPRAASKGPAVMNQQVRTDV